MKNYNKNSQREGELDAVSLGNGLIQMPIALYALMEPNWTKIKDMFGRIKT